MGQEINQSGAWCGANALPRQGAIEALYVHVPFCVRKCEYCDFYSEVNVAPGAEAAYVQAILREAELWRAELGTERFAIRTVFLGGGTPTLLSPSTIQQLLGGLRARLPLEAVEEWTVEANPGTVDAAYLRMLREERIDRLSVGVQSFDDRDLKWLGRIHDSGEAMATLAAAQAAGFGRLSVDLIFGIPGQSARAWEANLKRVMAMGLSHLSCYGLTYEEATSLGRRQRAGKVAAATEEEELALFRRTGEVLEEAGLERYEISNFARPGEECRHNLQYWQGANYLGLGPAGASHLAGMRWRNPPSVAQWGQSIRQGRLLSEGLDILSLRQRAGELAMLMLRTKRGLDCQMFQARLTIEPMSLFAAQFRELAAVGMLEVFSGGARLSRRGIEVADVVASEFLE